MSEMLQLTEAQADVAAYIKGRDEHNARAQSIRDAITALDQPGDEGISIPEGTHDEGLLHCYNAGWATVKVADGLITFTKVEGKIKA